MYTMVEEESLIIILEEKVRGGIREIGGERDKKCYGICWYFCEDVDYGRYKLNKINENYYVICVVRIILLV